MKFNVSILSLILAPICASAATSKNDFMRAMRSTKVQKDRKERKRRLNANIISAAVKKNAGMRTLAYYNDDANQGDDDNYGGYGFDMSTYSLKYAGCSTIATYSDDLAQDEDSETVFESDQYIMFRFCPSAYCSASSSKGCMDDYGEYMVPLETWLELMSDYREEEFERYCEYCDGCYGDGDGDDEGRRLEDAEADDGGDDADAAEGDDGANAGDDANADAGDDANADAGDDANANAGDDANADAGDDGANGDDNANEQVCAYESECSGYDDVCNNQNNVDYSKFFECKEFDVSDDLTLYIGPRCHSDKSSILLAVFSDEYCTEYVGNKYDLATITGEMLTSDSLSDYSKTDCIACKESELSFQNNANDNDDADDINEICENLYGYAAKCNRHMSSATSSSYQSYQQEDNEYAVCSFIASVVTGTYDENGYIYVDPMIFESDNKYNEYRKIAIRRGVVTTSQALSITSFSILFIGLAVYSLTLHLQIKRKTAFSADKREPLAMGRQNSGIMMARSDTVDSNQVV